MMLSTTRDVSFDAGECDFSKFFDTLQDGKWPYNKIGIAIQQQKEATFKAKS